MARFKRWTHGFVASIDNMIVQVENHEALAASALRELERGVARSKVQLLRVERDGRAISQALQEEREAVERWRDRAKREPEEARALECLKRHKRAQARSLRGAGSPHHPLHGQGGRLELHRHAAGDCRCRA